MCLALFAMWLRRLLASRSGSSAERLRLNLHSTPVLLRRRRRGQRYSFLAILAREGIIASTAVEESFNEALFEDFILEEVVRTAQSLISAVLELNLV